MQIGIFDSGIGGVTVLAEALKQLPNEDFLYYADTRNVPYGIKTKQAVREFIFKSVEFIASQGVKALVIACNTATSIAAEELRQRYDFPIIGMEPAVKPAVLKREADNKRVLVLATPLTLAETKFKNLVESLDSHHVVDSLPMPELVEFAESLTFDSSVILPYLRKTLVGFDLSLYSTIVLGCTHFIYFRDSLRELVGEKVGEATQYQVPSHNPFYNPRIDIIDGNAGTIRHLQSVLSNKGLDGGGSGLVSFFESGDRVSSESLKRYQTLLKRLSPPQSE